MLFQHGKSVTQVVSFGAGTAQAASDCLKAWLKVTSAIFKLLPEFAEHPFLIAQVFFEHDLQDPAALADMLCKRSVYHALKQAVEFAFGGIFLFNIHQVRLSIILSSSG